MGLEMIQLHGKVRERVKFCFELILGLDTAARLLLETAIAKSCRRRSPEEIMREHFQLVDQLNASPWQIRETNMRLAIGFIVMFFYLLIGAAVFVRIEGPAEDLDMQTYQEFRAHWNNVLMEAGFEERDIDQLFADIRVMALKGIWTEKNITNEPNWGFGQAFFFAGALISTVGKILFAFLQNDSFSPLNTRF
ncbi:unnamed protein product [Anisakis simplex]|uniref:DUF4359 domain-containing protein n=1 Tax=Anisakis simplex TaxID=6269 RepID=A0A0M3JD72_ANISI|nr:unnamed protein product [Anisakis simplex]